MIDEVLTVDEAARLFKVTPTTIRRWCLSGRIPAFKIGRAWRIPIAALERLINTSSESQRDEGLIAAFLAAREAAGKGDTADALWPRMSDYYEQLKRKEESRENRT